MTGFEPKLMDEVAPQLIASEEWIHHISFKITNQTH